MVTSSMRAPLRPDVSHVSHEEWVMASHYPAMRAEDAVQRKRPLREACDGLRSIVKTRAYWHTLPYGVQP